MKNKIILALLSAFLLWLGWPPVPYSAPVLFVAFVPLLVAIEQVIRSHENNKGRQVFFWLSFLTGFVWNTASIYWVYNAMNAYLPGYISLLIALIPFTLAPLLMATAFRLYYQLRKKKINRIQFYWAGLFLVELRVFAPIMGPSLPMDDTRKRFRKFPSTCSMV